MNPMNALRQYRNVNAHSQMADATPHQLIQMLMAGGLSRIAQAKGTMQRGQLAEKGIMIAKALSILGGLREALDFEKGGELAQQYASLYDYMVRRLNEANRSNDSEILDEVTALLLTLKEGWDAITITE